MNTSSEAGGPHGSPTLSPAPSLADVWSRRLLQPHFQPVVDIVLQKVYGYESLIRGPQDSPWREPAAVFREARELGVHARLELDCLRAGAADFPRDLGASLFLNFSGSALIKHWLEWGDALGARLLGDTGLSASQVVIELTEHDPVGHSIPMLAEAFAALRRAGLRVALDDYGVGHSSLQLWAEAQPDIVKIDRYFFSGIAGSERKQKMVRAILSVAHSFGTTVVAEGIETADDLEAALELGVRYAQGWLIGRPARDPVRNLSVDLRMALQRTTAARNAIEAVAGTVAALRVEAPVVLASTHTNDDVHRLFVEHRNLHAVAVLDDHQRPLGIVARRTFAERYAQRYTRELFGRDPCTTFMNAEPVTVDRNASIAQLSHVLLSEDQRYLVDGFIITADGRYDGLGTGEALVRSVTEMRIEAARYANPLTSLPGNIPISQHIGVLLERGAAFVACYADLNNFKPFNDVYGYWRGDDMIRLCAEVIRRHADPLCDFVGHVGGDDFVVLFLSEDWEERARRIAAEFDREARDLYDDAARARGGIEAEDRHGVPRFFPFVSLGIGAVRVEAGGEVRIRAEDVASAAAHVKHKVKRAGLSLIAETYSDALLDGGGARRG